MYNYQNLLAYSVEGSSKRTPWGRLKKARMTSWQETNRSWFCTLGGSQRDMNALSWLEQCHAEIPILPNYITETFEFKKKTPGGLKFPPFYEFMLMTGFSNKLIKIDFQYTYTITPTFWPQCGFNRRQLFENPTKSSLSYKGTNRSFLIYKKWWTLWMMLVFS